MDVELELDQYGNYVNCSHPDSGCGCSLPDSEDNDA